MRLAVDVTALHDDRTGIGVVTHELLDRLSRRDDLEIVVYSVSWRGRGRVASLVPDGVRVVPRPMAASPLRWSWRRWDRPPIEWWTGAVDVVLGPNFVVPPARRAARVALVHDLTAWRFPELCTADTLQYPDLVARAIAGGSHVITPSRAVAEEVIARTGAPAHRVHPVWWAATHVAGGDARAGQAVAGGGRYVLSLGTVEPRKDHVLLVQAFDRAADADASLRLVVAGPDGWGVERFDAAVATARHRDRIVRLGYVDDATRADLLAGASAFAYPSVYEGFGLPPLEALASGVPVVATAAGALPEVLGDAAILTDVADVDAFAAAITELTSMDDDRRRAVAERGRRHADGFSWERATDDVVAALAAAVAERPTIPRP